MTTTVDYEHDVCPGCGDTLHMPNGEPQFHRCGPHLWEVEHPYYCNESNYFSNDCTNEYDSWKSFLKDEGAADVDYNLVFRFDWSTNEETGEQTLLICWMGQRKGLYRSTTIRNMKHEDEPSVRMWLEWRWQCLKMLWAPISGEKERATEMPLLCTALLPSDTKGES